MKHPTLALCWLNFTIRKHFSSTAAPTPPTPPGTILDRIEVSRVIAASFPHPPFTRHYTDNTSSCTSLCHFQLFCVLLHSRAPCLAFLVPCTYHVLLLSCTPRTAALRHCCLLSIVCCSRRRYLCSSLPWDPPLQPTV